LAKGKTGGQQGDPLEMLVFNLTTLHLWSRKLTEYPQVRALAYDDDGYIKLKMSVGTPGPGVSDLKYIRKKNSGLDLNVSKTSILPKDISQQVACDVEPRMIPPAPHSLPILLTRRFRRHRHPHRHGCLHPALRDQNMQGDHRCGD
jgi:hypothetical protein